MATLYIPHSLPVHMAQLVLTRELRGCEVYSLKVMRYSVKVDYNPRPKKHSIML